jgi:hypothetical protein
LMRPKRNRMAVCIPKQHKTGGSINPI